MHSLGAPPERIEALEASFAPEGVDVGELQYLIDHSAVTRGSNLGPSTIRTHRKIASVNHANCQTEKKQSRGDSHKDE